MSASIEWGHASNATTSILGHFDTAGDNQSIADDSDNPGEIGVAFGGGGDGYILVGTPLELMVVLAGAMAQVAEHLGREG